MSHSNPSETPAVEAATRLYDRYRSPDQQPPAAWNATLDTLLAHRSVRAYLPDPLPPGALETIIAAAQSAPSSSNLQAWSVVVVEDPERKARLAALAGRQKHIVQAPMLMVWLVDLHRLEGLGKSNGTPTDGLPFLESFVLGAVDAALAAQNAVVALESLGLGSVYIGAMRNKPAEVAAELGLPPHVFAVFGLVVGHPDPAAPASVKPRLPQQAVVFREQYAADGTPEALAAYNARLREFQREQRMPERDWTALAADRVRDGAALHGRDALSGILHTMGFGLK